MQAAAAELAPQIATETLGNRRTDDITFNVRYLAQHIIDKQKGSFHNQAEVDVLEQDLTELAEADVHNLGATVYQIHNDELGQYVSLGIGTMDNAIKGRDQIDVEDPDNLFEYWRCEEEILEEQQILEPETQAGMRRGGIKIFVSPSPTHHEADPTVAAEFGYDGRTMFRVQTLSPDGRVKTMRSFSVFSAQAKHWAAFLGDRYGAIIEPTAIAVMRFCRDIELEFTDVGSVLKDFIGGVAEYLPSKEKANLETQLDAFLYDQTDLEEQTMYYAKEKLAFEKELALSLNSRARPAVLNTIRAVYDQLNEGDQHYLASQFSGRDLYVDDYVAELAMRIKTLTIDNRAGLATLNEQTIKRVASKVGLETTIELAHRERVIRDMARDSIDNDFMVRRTEQQIAESGVSCGGACSVQVVDLFSAEASKAAKAGLSGTLYTSSEMDQNSRCSCIKVGKKAKVISDGSSVVCVACGDYKVKGKLGNLKAKAA